MMMMMCARCVLQRENSNIARQLHIIEPFKRFMVPQTIWRLVCLTTRYEVVGGRHMSLYICDPRWVNVLGQVADHYVSTHSDTSTNQTLSALRVLHAPQQRV